MNEPLSFTHPDKGASTSIGRLLDWFARAFALGGGLVLLVLIGMSLVSIIGRKLFATPIRGDMELVEVGAAVAIAAFLPLCELRGNHLRADAFTLAAPAQVKRWLDALAHLLCALVAAILVWRTSLQLLDSREYGDATTLLGLPLWQALALIVPSLVLLAFCALQRVIETLREGARG